MCEVCKGIFCGKNFCYRCKCGSILDFVSNYYYRYCGNYRKLVRYLWFRRNINDEFEILKLIEQEERRIVVQEMVKEFGFIGLLVFYRFYVLYGFDCRKYCVFDVMYMVVFGVVRNNFNFFLFN